MSQEIDLVKVERDDGHNHRWAYGRWFYRKESQKESLAYDRLLYVFSGLFILTLVILLVRGPNQEVDSSSKPITLTSKDVGVSNGVQDIRAGVANSGSYIPKQNHKPSKALFKGVEHVERPRLATIPPVTIGQAILLSSATDGSVHAKLVEDLTFSGAVLLAKGNDVNRKRVLWRRSIAG